MENVSVSPMLATWKASKKDGRCPVHINVVINSKRFAFPSTKVKVHPDNWDAAHKKIKASAENSAVLNSKINKIKADIEAGLVKRQIMGKALNRAGVKKQIQVRKSGADFYAFCEKQVAQGKYSSETIRTYRTEITKLMQHRAVLTFADLDFSFLQGYGNYMRAELGNAPNTVWKSLKFVNTMVNLATNTGDYVGASPFEGFDRGNYTQGIPEYLEWHEVQQLHKAVKAKLVGRLQLIGYYSLLSCYSGLRFSDAIRFNYQRFVIEDTRGKRLLLYAKKNSEIVTMPFTKEIAEVVEFLTDKKLDITNQEFNRDLKVVGRGAGMSKSLKSHMFRHSFAMRCAEIGMSEETVQRLLGHKDRKSTRIYFRIKDNRVDDEMKLWSK